MNKPWLDPVRREFKDRLVAERLAHAFLLEGPAGTGKLSLARDMVASLLCLETSIPACGKCRSCQLLGSGAHPDYRELTFEPRDKKPEELRTEIVIHQVRTLIASLQLTTTISPRKVALIHPAEFMNRSAANALLKTLEEPPGDTVLIVLSHDPGRLPLTIRSRCQGLHVRMPDEIYACDWLMAEAGIEREAALEALRSAAGSPMRAMDMLEQGGGQQFRMVNTTLEELLAGTGDAGSAITRLSDIEPADLWKWLSLTCADVMRKIATGTTPAADQSRLAPRLRSLDHRGLRSLTELQMGADRNRSLVSTPVRKDLLLHDWLIQWSRLANKSQE